MRAKSWRQNLTTLIFCGLGVLFGVVFNTNTSWLVADCALLLVALSGLSLLWPLSRLQLVATAHHQTADAPLTFKLTPAAPVFGLTLTSDRLALPLKGRLGVLPAGLPRGVHTKLPIIARAYAPLGLLTKAHQLRPKTPIIVGPKAMRQEAEAVAQALASFHQAQALTAAASGEFDQLRRYRVGDPLNTINWKRTAATGIMLRQTFHDDVSTTWWGAFYGGVGPEFEQALGVFYALRHAQVFTQSFFLTDIAQAHLSWEALAKLQPATTPATLTLPPGVGLILVTAVSTPYAELVAQYPKHPLLVVRIEKTRFWLDQGGDAHA